MTEACSGVFSSLNGIEIIQISMEERSIFIIDILHFLLAEEAFFFLKHRETKKGKY